MRLAGGTKPRCETKSVPAAELQLAVQMLGELYPFASRGRLGPELGTWLSRGPFQCTGAMDVPSLGPWPALNSTAMGLHSADVYSQ